MRIPRVVVVGSVNMDLVARMTRLPRPGETVFGNAFLTVPGGKGANQAVAAARLGACVTIIGCVGDDGFGATLRTGLAENRVSTEHLLTASQSSSGVAVIQVDANGANTIAVIAGANATLTPEHLLDRRDVLQSAQVVVVQLETPAETVAMAIRLAREAGILTILDPAPAPDSPLPAELISVDVLSPNQTEAEALTGQPVDSLDSARSVARQLQQRGARNVVLKLGGMGAWVLEATGAEAHVPAQEVAVVDSTAAGDAFTGGLATGLAEGRSLVEAAELGCAAGSLACTVLGAQPALPTRATVDAFQQRGLSGG